jgi:uncharacterized protein (AIM24 family)
MPLQFARSDKFHRVTGDLRTIARLAAGGVLPAGRGIVTSFTGLGTVYIQTLLAIAAQQGALRHLKAGGGEMVGRQR